MKSWKKRLHEEFEAAVPALSREVLNAPVQSVKEEEKPRAKKISPLKKRLFFGSGFAAAALAIVLDGMYPACRRFDAGSTVWVSARQSVLPAVFH